MSNCTKNVCPKCSKSAYVTQPNTSGGKPLRCNTFKFRPNDTAEDTYELLQTNVEYANEALRPAGVQFYIKSIENYNMPHFSDATEAGDILLWKDVRDELHQVLPIEDNMYGSSQRHTARQWLRTAAAYYGDPHEIMVWLPYFGGGSGQGDYPNEGTSMYIPVDNLYTYKYLFAHELGHFFGLPHSFNNLNPADGTGGEFDIGADRKGSPIIDPLTDLEITSRAHFWDLVYATDSLGEPVTFRTENEALLADSSPNALLPINSFDTRKPVGAQTNCSMVYVSGPSGPRLVQCTVAGITTFDPVVLNGMRFSSPSGRQTANLMTYDVGVQDVDPAMTLSASQIRHVRRVLRYQMQISSLSRGDWPTGGLYANQRPLANRPLLGESTKRSIGSDLDFDGDGKRDLAVWDPPSTPTAYGTYRIRLYRDSFATEYTFPMGKLGDIPLPGRINQDGTTDLLMVTKADRGDPYDRDVAWQAKFCHYAGGALSCVGPSNGPNAGYEIANLGRTGDIFFTDLETDGDTSTREIVAYRPETSTYFWCNALGSGISCSKPKSKKVGEDDVQNIPMPGLYDSDNTSDLVVYSAKNATWSIQRSSGNPLYSSTPIQRHWDLGIHAPRYVIGDPPELTAPSRTASIPLANMVHNTEAGRRVGATLWDPSWGGWYVDWNLVGSSDIDVTDCGVSGGDPLPGLDRNQDGYTDVATFSSRTATTLSWRVSNGSQCGSTVIGYSLPIRVSERAKAYVVASLTPDTRRDIVIIDPEPMKWYIVSSESNYTEIAWSGQFGSTVSSPL